MTERQISLSIANPCSEKWNDFAPTATGGLCSSCNKNVIDFTNKSDAEILRLLTDKPSNTCGRFQKSQLKVYSQNVASNNSIGLKWVQAGILGMSLLLVNNHSLAQIKPNKEKTEIDKDQPSKMEGEALPKTHTVKGTVVDKDAKEPIPGVYIVLKGTSTGTVSDIDGKFTFPGKLKEGDVLVFSFVGYETKEYKIPKDAPEIVEMPMMVLYYDIMGEVAIEEVYTAKPSGLKSFWGKIKRIF